MSRVLLRFDEAEHYLLRALDVDEEGSQGESERGALIRNNLGEVYLQLGRLDEARASIEQALQMRVRLHGEFSERAWRSRLALCRLERTAGRAAQALALAREAIGRVEAAQQTAWYLMLAGAALDIGDIDAAEPIYDAVYEQASVADIGASVPLEIYLEVLEGVTRCRMARQDWLGATSSAARVLAVARQELPALMRGACEAQIVHLLRSILDVQSLWLMALWRAGVETPGATDASDAFQMVQLTKGLRTRYVRVLQPGDGKVEYLLPADQEQALQAVRSEIRTLVEQLTADSLTTGDAPALARSRTTIGRRARLRQLEREVAACTGVMEVAFDLLPTDLDDRLLDGVLVAEIVLARDVPAERRGTGPNADRYVAFVAGPGASAGLGLFDIGLVQELDAAIGDLRQALMHRDPAPGNRMPEWRRLSKFLGRKVLRAFGGRFEAARHLVVAPDGAFGALPFELLSAPRPDLPAAPRGGSTTVAQPHVVESTPDGSLLIDRLHVSYVMRVAEWLRRDRDFVQRGASPLVIASPDFDLPRAFTVPRPTALGLPAKALVAWQARAGGFVPLQEGYDEGAAIARALGVEALLGPWALSSELLNSGAPEIIHVSTHGFVIPREGLADDPLQLAAPLGNLLDRRMVLEDPLQRSGLAFAGANAALAGRSLPAAAGDGIVYASAIQQLDLQRTDLVVLSACRSALGQMAAADGAHGLRRAFLAAGCRTVVSALWDVPEASSRTWSSAFYDALLAGRSRLDALQAARATVRAHEPDDPIHWAGFVLDGATGPLERFSGVGDLKIASASMRAWGIGANPSAEDIDRFAKRLVEGPPSRRALTVHQVRTALSRQDLAAEDRVGLLAWHADLANKLGDNARAIADYGAAQMLAKSAAARQAYAYNIAKIQQQEGLLDEAIEGYTCVLTQDPEPDLRATVRVNRGMALLGRGDRAAARADMSAVIEDGRSPPEQRWKARLNRASLCLEEDPASSLEDVTQALALGIASEPETLTVRAFRIQALSRAGQDEEALDECRLLLADPATPVDLRERLREWQALADGAG